MVNQIDWVTVVLWLWLSAYLGLLSHGAMRGDIPALLIIPPTIVVGLLQISHLAMPEATRNLVIKLFHTDHSASGIFWPKQPRHGTFVQWVPPNVIPPKSELRLVVKSEPVNETKSELWCRCGARASLEAGEVEVDITVTPRDKSESPAQSTERKIMRLIVPLGTAGLPVNADGTIGKES